MPLAQVPSGEVEQLGGAPRDRKRKCETVNGEGFLGDVAADNQIRELRPGTEQASRQQFDRHGQRQSGVVVAGTDGHPLGTTVVGVRLDVGDGEQGGPRPPGSTPEQPR